MGATVDFTVIISNSIITTVFLRIMWKTAQASTSGVGTIPCSSTNMEKNL